MKIADISILNSCNFSCNYCKSDSSHIRENNKGIWDISGPVLDFLPLIEFVKTNLNSWIIQITGGEPLTVPGIEFLLNELVKTNVVILCTNGSLLQRKYRYLDKRIKMRISLHPDQRTLTEFVENIKDVDPDRFVINYMVHPLHIKSGKSNEYINFLSDLDVPFEVTAFDGIFRNETYKVYSDVYTNIIDHPPQVLGVTEIIVIRPNGKIFSCHGDCDHEIGDIYANTFDAEKICKNNCKTSDRTSLCPIYDGVIKQL